MSKPKCFHSEEQFLDWARLARLSKEIVSVCNDCSKEFQSEMEIVGKCEREVWEKIFWNSTSEPKNSFVEAA